MVVESKRQNTATKWSYFPIFIYIQFPEGWLCDFLDFQHLLKKNKEQSHLISRGSHCLTLMNYDLRTLYLFLQTYLCAYRYGLNLTLYDRLCDRQRKTRRKKGPLWGNIYFTKNERKTNSKFVELSVQGWGFGRDINHSGLWIVTLILHVIVFAFAQARGLL